MKCHIAFHYCPLPIPEEHKHRVHGSLTVHTEDLFENLLKYIEKNQTVSKPYWLFASFSIDCQHGDSTWQAVEALLTSHGITLRFTMRLRWDEVGKVARVTTDSKPTAAELKKAEYFRFWTTKEVWKNGAQILSDGPWLNHMPEYNAALAALPEDPLPVEIFLSDSKKHPKVETLSAGCCLYFSPEMKESAKKAGIDLNLGQILWARWDNSKKQLLTDYPNPPPGGHLETNVTMPRCLTKMISPTGETIERTSDEKYDFLWDDHGETRPRLQYRRSEVEELGAFDVARIVERGGQRIGMGGYIVSRKFRDWTISEKLGITWDPIILLDE